MSGKIQTELNNLTEKISTIKNGISISKKSLADALRFNGITNVSDTETFARYAYLIKRLKSVNAMILQFTIPETAKTDYKRTIVLPMQFGIAGNADLNLNIIAKEIIANDNGNYSAISRKVTRSKLSDVETDTIENHIIQDVYGNEIIDGTYVAPITMEDVHEYLTDEQAEEFLEAADNLGISLMSLASEDEIFEPDATATYSYTVDWGDGTGEFIFDNNKTAIENADAIYHTYAKSGTYDISINGVFKRILTQGDDQGNLENGTIKDADGTYTIINNYNYAMIKHLVEVIAWGNTMLSNMESSFRRCEQLTTIPMYDTTNSFEEVTSFNNAFRRCYKLKSLPFNENTNKGLFSGSSKATNFAGCFRDCTGLTGNIPPKLIDGCPNVTTVSEMFYGCTGITGKIPVDMITGLTKLTTASLMFYNCKGINDELTPGLFTTCPNISNISGMYQSCTGLHGNIPEGMFTGVSTLTNVGDLFNNCTGLDGEIPNDLFEDCINITNITGVFYNCKNIIGKIKHGAFSNLSKLTTMQRAFRYCSGLTGFESNAFEHLSANGLNCFEAFENCTSLTSIPEHLLDGISGLNVRLDRMFTNCTSIQSIGTNNLSSLKVADARGIFGGCTALTTIEDFNMNDTNYHNDWNDSNSIKRWYGAFANTAIGMSENSPIYAELGGFGERKYSNEIGKIVLSDKSTVEIKDFIYNAENPPIALVYADMYVDPSKSIATLPNGQGNVVTDETEGAVRKIYASVLNDMTRTWTNGQTNAEDINTITNTSDVSVAYSRYTWSADGLTATLNPTRYNGEAYTKAINDWRVSKNMAVKVGDAYTKTSTDKYDAVDYCMTYKLNGIDQQCFMPDAADLWTQYTIREFQAMALNKIINESNGVFTNSNTNPIRLGTTYWASAEGSSTYAWLCYTRNAHCRNWDNKWLSIYVRPSLALDVA